MPYYIGELRRDPKLENYPHEATYDGGVLGQRSLAVALETEHKSMSE